jgi:Secretion system C-terminal sorting domain/Metallo-peptidase family M12B Reprolysin-like
MRYANYTNKLKTMKKSTLFIIFGSILMLLKSFPTYSQVCGSHQHIEEFIHQEIKEGKITADEGRKMLQKSTNSLKLRSRTIRVRLVYDLPSTTTGLTLAGAQTFLNDCASSISGCEVIFEDVTPSRTEFDFSASNLAANVMLSTLNARAVNQNWYSNADIVVGFTSKNMTFGGGDGTAGFANIGNCNGPIGRTVVIEASIYNSLFAHELGHIIGLVHDDLGLLSETSLMNPTIYPDASTMALFNKNCHRTSVACAALPVELLQFSGQYSQNKNQLSWTTASEKNNKGFQIERSYDATHWLSMGYVKGVGNSDTKNTYTFQDASPLGLSYYRLRQQDFDGTETFSNIVSIKSDSKTKVILAPNPVQNDLVISFESETYAEEVNVYDLLGRVVFQRKKPSGRLEVDMRNVQAGMYIVEINMDGKRVREKILKVNE